MHRLKEVVRRKQLALATERSSRAWLRRYCEYLKRLICHLPGERKLERFLTALAKNFVAASTQNQAINAVIFLQRGSGVGVEKLPGFAGQRAGPDSTRPGTD